MMDAKNPIEELQRKILLLQQELSKEPTKPVDDPEKKSKPRPKGKAPQAPTPTWQPMVEQGMSVLTELVRSFQAQAKARADVEIRRMELETQAMERMLRLLDATTTAIGSLMSLTIEREAAIVQTLARLQDIGTAPSKPQPVGSNDNHGETDRNEPRTTANR
jgi:hypothetical protein